MAELLGESDRIRFLLPKLHHEMVGELRFPGRDTLEEGLDVRTLELSPPELAALELLRRPDVMEHLAEWRAGQVLGARTRAAVELELGHGRGHRAPVRTRPGTSGAGPPSSACG